MDTPLPVGLKGIPVSKGIGVGQGWVVEEGLFKNEPEQNTLINPLHEKARFLKALETSYAKWIQLDAKKGLFFLSEVYALIAQSPSFQEPVLLGIAQGQSAVSALKTALGHHKLAFEKLTDPHLKERSSDLITVVQSILNYLNPLTLYEKKMPDSVILILNTLSVARLFDIPKECLKGIISPHGTFHSHVAIVARSMGIPAILGIQNSVLREYEGYPLAINGSTGEIRLADIIKVQAEPIKDPKNLSIFPFHSSSCIKIPLDLYINMDGAQEMDFSQALAQGAKGVGLYRTEIDFMKFKAWPTEQEQYALYHRLLTKVAPYPVHIRVLDIGGDKPLPYFHLPKESNPALGMRGIRVLLKYPDIFMTHLIAILRASEGLNNLRILLPMINSVAELEKALEFIHRAFDALSHLDIIFPLIGVMIEVPSAVFQIKEIVRRVDFISIGSNDLTQYLLAVDRSNSAISSLYDYFHPAVLQALDQIVKEARTQGKPVSLCGEMAHEPLALKILIELGLDSISLDAQYLGSMKEWLFGIDMKKLKDIFN